MPSTTNRTVPSVDETEIDTRDLLNAQTGRIAWAELQRHFARGLILVVDPELDLIEVAARMIEDDKDVIERWMDTGRLARAGTAHAKSWHAVQPELWAVVVAPWVLVQGVARQRPGGTRDLGGADGM